MNYELVEISGAADCNDHWVTKSDAEDRRSQVTVNGQLTADNVVETIPSIIETTQTDETLQL